MGIFLLWKDLDTLLGMGIFDGNIYIINEFTIYNDYRWVVECAVTEGYESWL
jgi:hypothetical protein